MPYVQVYVDEDDILDDLSVEEIAAYLVKIKGWKEAINNVLHDAANPCISFEPDDFELLLRDFYFGFPIESQLQKMCQEKLGLFKPIFKN